MALLHDSVDFKKLDVRLIERNLARGVLTPADLDSATKNLPNDEENADWVSLASLSNESEDADSGHKPS